MVVMPCLPSQETKKGNQLPLNVENKSKHQSASSKGAPLCLCGVEGKGRGDTILSFCKALRKNVEIHPDPEVCEKKKSNGFIQQAGRLILDPRPK